MRKYILTESFFKKKKKPTEFTRNLKYKNDTFSCTGIFSRSANSPFVLLRNLTIESSYDCKYTTSMIDLFMISSAIDDNDIINRIDKIEVNLISLLDKLDILWKEILDNELFDEIEQTLCEDHGVVKSFITPILVTQKGVFHFSELVKCGAETYFIERSNGVQDSGKFYDGLLFADWTSVKNLNIGFKKYYYIDENSAKDFVNDLNYKMEISNFKYNIECIVDTIILTIENTKF